MSSRHTLPNVSAILAGNVTRDTAERDYRKECRQAAKGLPYKACEMCGDTLPPDEDCCEVDA
jgi:hypothetical protein